MAVTTTIKTNMKEMKIVPIEVDNCVDSMVKKYKKDHDGKAPGKDKLSSFWAICNASHNKMRGNKEVTSEGIISIKGCNVCEDTKEADAGVRIIRFVAVTNLESNGERGPRNVLKEGMHSLLGKPVVDYHPEKTFWSWKRKFGIITDVEYKEDEITIGERYYPELPRIECVAEIFEDHIIKLLDRMMITNFSVSYLFNAIPDENGILVWTWVEFRNVGMVDYNSDAGAVLLSIKEVGEIPSLSCDLLHGKKEKSKKLNAAKEGDTMEKNESKSIIDGILDGLKEAVGKGHSDVKKEEVNQMENAEEFAKVLKESEKEMSGLKEQNKELAGKIEKLKDSTSESEGLKEKFDKTTKELETAQASLKEISEVKRKESVKASVKELIKDGKIAPAEEGKVTTLLEGLSEESAKATVDILSERQSIGGSGEQGEQSGTKEGEGGKEGISETLYGLKEADLVAQLSRTKVISNKEGGG